MSDLEKFQYNPDRRVVNSARAFIRSLIEVYGHEEGLRIWDTIRSNLGDEAAGDIFVGMLIGRADITVHSIGPNYIDAIKTVRSFTSMGLKEAKDFCEAVRDGEPQTIRFGDQSEGSIDEFTKLMTRLGCRVS